MAEKAEHKQYCGSDVGLMDSARVIDKIFLDRLSVAKRYAEKKRGPEGGICTHRRIIGADSACGNLALEVCVFSGVAPFLCGLLR